MKTLRLTRAESIAYANGERRFWRAIKPKPDRAGRDFPHLPYWNIGGYRTLGGASNQIRCPYGDSNRIEVTMRDCPGAVQHDVKLITVEQRGGRWGWVVEVGA
jgi:hypothetical protein